MTLQETLKAIAAVSTDSIKRILMKHDAREPIYGAKVADLKVILKKIKNDQQLALQLYDSGVYDAQYLAGLMADGSKMTPAQLDKWARTANSHGISQSTVVWVAAEHPDAWKLGLEWIEDKNENVASSGWNLVSGLTSLKPDAELDIPQLRKLLKRVEKDIHKAPNWVRYTMNNFVIHLGTYVEALHEEAVEVARRIGLVSVNVGDTACKVPVAEEYIGAARKRGPKKKKTLKC
ncbi:DNA alkylation repair protein [Chitinophaga barathri]|uniref:DNA alkylation repair protein n=1 Tax=Chitinophaga barathri TaxID=1647451 RepID=A0A3N4M525_9BACT|nr:DNA alkylation repair protein [Chitinophaga barathri]RPD38281.1 DNA alkylation repair protein [Chitinophaga barathri]